MNSRNKIFYFVKKKEKKILCRNLKENLKKFKKGEKDLDFLDREKILRNEFEKLLKKLDTINLKNYHKTGLRYNIIDRYFNLYSIDFLNGLETNPLFFNFYKKKINHQKQKIHYRAINLQNIHILFKNIFSQIKWRLVSIINQKPEFIEFFGVDGSGKSYLSDKFFLKFNKQINFKKLHLWNETHNIIKKKSTIPYKMKSYPNFLSQLKEIFILLKLINLYIKINLHHKRKGVYLIERSCWDIFIDPQRYRMSHKPYLIKFFLKIIFPKSNKILIIRDFEFINKNKNELNLRQFKRVNALLRNFFKNEKIFMKIS